MACVFQLASDCRIQTIRTTGKIWVKMTSEVITEETWLRTHSSFSPLNVEYLSPPLLNKGPTSVHSNLFKDNIFYIEAFAPSPKY